jgi:methionine-gamma-lyase
MDRVSKKTGRSFHPETLALGLGYDPARSEGAVKPPVFLTSTFQFHNSGDGKEFFQAAYGIKDLPKGKPMGLIYSRLNNPNLEILEERIAAWDHTDKAVAFASGMAAISTTMFALLRPGDVVISVRPVYGGTYYLLENILPEMGIAAKFVMAGDGAAANMKSIAKALEAEAGRPVVKMLYIESPANPNNMMTDIQAVSDLAKELSTDDLEVIVVVDNTFLGPVFQRPSDQGAQVIIYSATKFIGGHSDLVAGLASGRADIIEQVGLYRTIMGTMADPFTAWMMTRSLETVSVRMRRQAKNAAILAEVLSSHPKITKVFYPTLFEEGSIQAEIYENQCSGPGSLIAFEVEGGEEAAFAVLDSFEIMRLAVSLGGTESLVEHPMRMTHSDIPPEELEEYGVSEGMIRMSVGIEHINDLKRDLLQALEVLG